MCRIFWACPRSHPACLFCECSLLLRGRPVRPSRGHSGVPCPPPVCDGQVGGHQALHVPHAGVSPRVGFSYGCLSLSAGTLDALLGCLIERLCSLRVNPFRDEANGVEFRFQGIILTGTDWLSCRVVPFLREQSSSNGASGATPARRTRRAWCPPKAGTAPRSGRTPQRSDVR